MNPDDIVALVRQASFSPSVHNVQPVRWRIEEDGVTLFLDHSRDLPAGDPNGNDAAMSVGAAIEGFVLAAGSSGLAARVEEPDKETIGRLDAMVRVRLTTGAAADPLASHLVTRRSHRGTFLEPTPTDRDRVRNLGADDAAAITDPEVLVEAGRRLEEASWSFMKDHAFRSELLSWMRLTRDHPDWDRDGLNADAMAMGRLEAVGARLVLGPLFGPLRTVGLARPLVSDGDMLARDVGIILFHRPIAEDRMESGRHLHRLWLRIEAAGFGAQVLASLIDDEDTAGWVADVIDLPEGRRLLSAFRVGRRPPGDIPAPARLPVEELLISG